MNIIIDIRWIRKKKLDGISQVILNIVKNILEIDTKNEYKFLYNKEDTKDILEKFINSDKNNYQFIKTDIKLFSLKEIFCLRKFLKNLKADIFYSPHFVTFPFNKNYKTILTVHDLIPFILPETLSKSSLKWKIFYKFHWPTKFLLKKADLVITVSENSKKDLVRLFGVDDKKISIIYNGVSEHKFNENIKEKVLLKYHLPDNFILYVGRFDPYKNVTNIIKAYSKLSNIKNEFKLVIVGDTKSAYYPELSRLVDKLNLKGNVIFSGYVLSEDLPLLYHLSLAFIFPSLYEGFGLPILEAFSVGTPVLTSNTSSLPEVAGNAAVLVDPKNIGEIAESIKKVLQDENLKQSLIQKGYEQSKKFSWKNSANKLLDIFNEVKNVH